MKFVDRLKDKILEIGQRFFPTPPEILTHCPLCQAKLTSVIHINDEKPNFYMCRGRYNGERHTFDDMEHVKKVKTQVQKWKLGKGDMPVEW